MKLRRSCALAALALATAGCSTSRSLIVNRGSDDSGDSLGTKRTTIQAYVTRGGTRHEFEGYAELTRDSLRLTRPHVRARGLELARPGEIRALPRDSVIAVEAVSQNLPGTLVLTVAIAGALLVVAGIGLAVGFASWP